MFNFCIQSPLRFAGRGDGVKISGGFTVLWSLHLCCFENKTWPGVE